MSYNINIKDWLNYKKINNLKYMKEDKVNHPSHYTWLKKLCGIEVIDITRHLNFNCGNIVKYTLRNGRKKEEGYSDLDKQIEDMQKVEFYAKDEINRLLKLKCLK